MFNTKSIRRLLVALMAGLTVTGTAMAQSTILVIDQNRIMRESEVGKHKRPLSLMPQSVNALSVSLMLLVKKA
jgi:hypothetical protein